MRFPRLYLDTLNVDKAIHTLHRICHSAIASPTLIYAVIYYAERERWYFAGQPLYGETFLAYRHAAIPSWANHAYMTLKLPTRDIGLYMQLSGKFLIQPDGSLLNKDMTQRGDSGLSQDERNAIDNAINWYKSSNEHDITLSRRDICWRDTKHREIIAIDDLRKHGNKPPSPKEQVPSPKEMLRLDNLVHAWPSPTKTPVPDIRTTTSARK